MVVLLLLSMLPACAIGGLNFRQDDRLTISSPEDRSIVTLPVTVVWQVNGFEITGRDGRSSTDAGSFGVLVDRAPPPPGEALESLADGDPSCARDPACPDEDYLEGIGAYETTQTSLIIERLIDLTPDIERREFHKVTVVFLDGKGRRIGESAFIVDFELDRKI